MINKHVKEAWKEYFPQAILGGGYIRSIFDGSDVEDYDFFIDDKAEYENIVYNIRKYKKKTFSNSHEVYKRLFNTELSKGLKNYKIQLILVDYEISGNPKKLADEFDFTVCSSAMTLDGDLYVNSTFFRDIYDRTLYPNKITYPLSTIKRMEKYIKKRYTVSNSLAVEVAKAIQELSKTKPLNDKSLDYYGCPIDKEWDFTGFIKNDKYYT